MRDPTRFVKRLERRSPARYREPMQGIHRRILYVTLYEGVAIAATTLGVSLFGGHSAGEAGVVAVVSSAIAVAWNLAFNTVFEAWEARQPARGRSVLRRIAHAALFEGGLTVFLVPMIAWALDISLWRALVYDIGLLSFFLVYTYGFTWGFDRVFGLPASAREAA
jgi:uncharacterized membrane protein